MCDGCGCDKEQQNPYTRKAKPLQRKDGWHIYVDGSVHKHEQPQSHEQPSRQDAPRSANMQDK